MRQSRLSGAVTLVSKSLLARAFLTNPGVGYVQAWVRFGPDMPDDVIMFVDQEWLEGVTRPKHVSGGDWMALVGVQRSGAVWVAAGTAGMKQPSSERQWKIFDLKRRLSSDIWYQLRVVADFGKRQFLSFEIGDGGFKQTIALGGLPLDYPNYAPFDRSAMIYCVGTMRSRDMMKVPGTPVAYFDDVEAGIRLVGMNWRLLSDGFERQPYIGEQPVTAPIVKTDSYEEGRWYKEREEALLRIENVTTPRPVGYRVCAADASLGD